MIKKILFTTSLMFAFFVTAATAQTNVGYMSTNKVLNQLPRTQEIQQELNQFIQKKQQKLRSKTTNYQDAVADFQTNKESMSAQEKKQTKKQLRQLSQKLSKFNQSIRKKIQQKRNELLLPVLEAIDAAIASVAEKKGLDLVINKTTNAGATVIFYASQAQEDITQEVLNKVKSTIE